MGLVVLPGRVSSSESEATVTFWGGLGGASASVTERYELF